MSLLRSAIGALVLLAAGCASPEPSPAAGPLPVEVVTVEAAAGYRLERTFVGEIRAPAEATLAFARRGRLVEVVRPGARVEAGQVLARLEPSGLFATGRRRQEQRAQASVALERAEAERARVQGLGAAATERERDEAHYAVEMARAALRAAEAGVSEHAAEARETALRAPFAGTVVARDVEPGAVVGVGEPVVVLHGEGRREARVGVPVAWARGIEASAEVEVAIADRRHPAVVLDVAPRVNPATATREVRLALPPDVGLPGEAMALVLDEVVATAGYWLPRSALLAGERGLFLAYGVDHDERVVRHAVEVLTLEGDRAFARGTLTPGHRVIRAGLHRVAPGQPVRVVDAPRGEPKG